MTINGKTPVPHGRNLLWITPEHASPEVRRQQNATRDAIYFWLIVAGTVAMTCYVLTGVGNDLVRELDVHDVCAQWGCM